jgi:hypothetical protein
VTFPAAGQDPSTIDPFTTPPTTGTVYDGTSLYNSALLATGAPGTGSTYELTFPDAGTFNYICALHGPLGQTGSIVVAAAPVVTPPPTDVGRSLATPAGDGFPWVAIGFMTLLVMMSAAVRLAIRRR